MMNNFDIPSRIQRGQSPGVPVDALKAHLQTPHMKAYGPIGQTFRQSSTFHVLTEAK